MCERFILKRNAKDSLRNFFGSALLVLIIQMGVQLVVSSIFSSEYFSISMDAMINSSYVGDGFAYGFSIRYVLMLLLTVFITYPISVGVIGFFIDSRKKQTAVSTIFSIFKDKSCMNVAITMLLKEIYIALWSLLFVIPGLVKNYEYYFIPYILAEHPDMSRREAFQLSREMTSGYKWDIFVFELSFLFWHIGALFTFGLLYIYLAPYQHAAFTELYECLKANYERKHTNIEYTGGMENII